MKLQNKKILYLIIVSIAVISVISAGFIETCIQHEWKEYDCSSPDGLEEPQCRIQKKPECTNFWSEILK